MYLPTTLHCSRFHRLCAITAGLLALLSSCNAQHHQPAAAAGATPAKQDVAADFNALLKRGDYAAAIAFVSKAAEIPASEKEGVVGTLILDGLVDPKATTSRPISSVTASREWNAPQPRGAVRASRICEANSRPASITKERTVSCQPMGRLRSAGPRWRLGLAERPPVSRCEKRCTCLD